MKIRRILSIVVPIGAIILITAFILTFAIVPLGGGSFAARGGIQKQPDRYVQMVTTPQFRSEKEYAEWSRLEFRDSSATTQELSQKGYERRKAMRVRRKGKGGTRGKLGPSDPAGDGEIVGNQGLMGVLRGGHGGELDQSLSEAHGMSGGFGGLELHVTGGGKGGYGTGVARIRRRGEHNVNVSVGRPVIMGSLSMEVIRRVIRSHRDQIKYCYSRELTRDPNLAGKVAVKFTISPRGYITQAAVSQTSLNNAAVERCITQKIRTWKFPRPQGGGIVIVNYPFILQSSGAPTEPRPILDSKIEEPPPRQFAFIPASGYFKNTYLPGDPALEWLRRRLEKDISLDGQALNIERAVVPYVQPFDPPAYDGLAVYLNADRTYLEEPGRITVQVGLKGSERHARRRACLNAALVVDLRSVSSEENRRILWSLADAMAGDLQAGDRFYLVVAGVEKPLRVKPDRFDSSTVRRHLAQALGELEAGEPSTGILEALNVAYQALKGEGADDAPIGANLVILASAAPLSIESELLRQRAHQAALEGITLTAVGVGARADMESLASLALAGQGRRRLLDDFNRARAALEEELSASGRAVARAVRLRIRLSKGVKLIKVLGSGPLDEKTSERVRKVEQVIDFKVADTLGIEADRGEDEDGIQIIIPAYYSGDDHAVLLEVMAPGPGKIADVRVRYKDLVNLKNAVARASLTLMAGRQPDNPLSRNVNKNVLAHRFSEDLQQAGMLLESGQEDAARRVLNQSLTRIQELRASHPALADDPELARDVAVLTEYRGVIAQRGEWSHQPEIRTHLVDSLAYAGRVKLPPGAQ
jgi:hypothetical protein